MPFANVSLASVLFDSYVLFWSAMAVSPIDWHSWALASVIPTVVVRGSVLARRALPLSKASYLLIGAFIALHTIGAHYMYARVPLGDSLSIGIMISRIGYARRSL